MNGKNLVAAAIAVSLLQIAFLVWIVAGRAAILRDGREVVLKVEPVDPRDLLRGDYVRLNYEISSVPADLVSNAPSESRNSAGATIFVRLAADPDGYWHIRSASLGVPAGIPEPDEADIRGEVRSSWSRDTFSVDYGIERYYVPEGEGRAIEAELGKRPFAVRAALAKDGTSQIKALIDGNTVLYEEPLY